MTNRVVRSALVAPAAWHGWNHSWVIPALCPPPAALPVFGLRMEVMKDQYGTRLGSRIM